MSIQELPDIIDYELKILFIGYNPGLRSAAVGHHYAGRSNGFWRLLHEAGLTPFRFQPEEDRRLLQLGLGSTNIVDRPSKGISELKTAEFRKGAVILRCKLEMYKPYIACYVGIGVYKAFTVKTDVRCGLQAENTVEGVLDYICPSPSGLNRIPYETQLEYFKGLKHIAGVY